MLSVGSRNAKSPWESETVCSFLTFGRGVSGGGSGITTTSALGRENPLSRKTVPATRKYGSTAFFLSPRAGKAKTAARIRRLILLFFLFLLLIFVLLLVVVYVFVLFLLFFFVLILACFEFQRIQAGDDDRHHQRQFHAVAQGV